MSKWLVLLVVCILEVSVFSCTVSATMPEEEILNFDDVYYEMVFDNELVYLRKTDALDILYYTDNVNIGLSNSVYGFSYNGAELFISPSDFYEKDMQVIESLPTCKVLSNETLSSIELLGTVPNRSSVIQSPTIELHQYVWDDIIPEECRSTSVVDWALVKLDSGEYGAVYREYVNGGLVNKVTKNIEGIWWVSPVSMLILRNASETHELVFHKNPYYLVE